MLCYVQNAIHLGFDALGLLLSNTIQPWVVGAEFLIASLIARLIANDKEGCGNTCHISFPEYDGFHVSMSDRRVCDSLESSQVDMWIIPNRSNYEHP